MRTFGTGAGRFGWVLGAAVLAVMTVAGCGASGPAGSADEVKAKISADVAQVMGELRADAPDSANRIPTSDTTPVPPTCTGGKRSSAYSMSWTFPSYADQVTTLYNNFGHSGSEFMGRLGYYWNGHSLDRAEPTFEGWADNTKSGLHMRLRMSADGDGIGATVHVEVSATADCR